MKIVKEEAFREPNQKLNEVPSGFRVVIDMNRQELKKIKLLISASKLKSKKVAPISPNNEVFNIENMIPGIIITAFNNLLERNYKGNNKISIQQKDVIEEILSISDFNRNEIFDNNYLDVEKIYENYGWSVIYKKCPYNEDWESYFQFTKPPQGD